MPSRPLLYLTARAEELQFHQEKLGFLWSKTSRYDVLSAQRDDHTLIAQIPRRSDHDRALVAFAKQPRT
jgi:hypothetical protein